MEDAELEHARAVLCAHVAKQNEKYRAEKRAATIRAAWLIEQKNKVKGLTPYDRAVTWFLVAAVIYVVGIAALGAWLGTLATS